MLTEIGISPNVPAGQVLVTLSPLHPLYGVLGVMWFVLMKRYALEGVHSSKANKAADEAPTDLSFGY